MNKLTSQQEMSGELMNAVELMLAELESSCLEVVLVPCKRYANEGGMIRVAQQRNTKWYRTFCGKFSSDRRRKNNAFDTRIKRRDTIRALNGILAGRYFGKYRNKLINIARNLK